MERYKRKFDEANLREVEVTFSDGSVLKTSLAAHLSDEEIKNYYKAGTSFNIGHNEDDHMVKVKSVKIIK